MNPVASFSDYASNMDFGQSRSSGGLNISGGGVTIKQHDLMNLSRPQVIIPDKFDEYSKVFRNLRVGTRIKGVKVNTGFNKKNKPQYVVGKMKSIKIDRTKQLVSVFISDPSDHSIIEIYPNSIQIMNEGYVKTLDDFLVKD